MENNEGILTKSGIVIFLEANKGSKSEGIYPYLYESAENCIRIMMQDDNPFENIKLRPYDGMRVIISGSIERGNIFIINNIEKESDKN